MKYTLILIVIFSISVTCQAQRKLEFYHFEDDSLMIGDTLLINEGSLGGQYVFIYTIWGGTPPIKLPFEGRDTMIIIDHFRRKKDNGRRIVYVVGYLPNLKNVSVYIEIEGAVKSGEVVLR